MSYEKIVSQVEFAIRQEVRHLEVHNDLLDKCQTTEPNFAEISAIKNIREVIEMTIESMIEHGEKIPAEPKFEIRFPEKSPHEWVSE